MIDKNPSKKIHEFLDKEIWKDELTYRGFGNQIGIDFWKSILYIQGKDLENPVTEQIKNNLANVLMEYTTLLIEDSNSHR